jgi:glutamine synthetase
VTARGFLPRAARARRSLGFRFNLGIEPEFFVLREDGRQPAPITRTQFRARTPATT